VVQGTGCYLIAKYCANAEVEASSLTVRLSDSWLCLHWGSPEGEKQQERMKGMKGQAAAYHTRKVPHSIATSSDPVRMHLGAGAPVAASRRFRPRARPGCGEDKRVYTKYRSFQKYSAGRSARSWTVRDSSQQWSRPDYKRHNCSGTVSGLSSYPSVANVNAEWSA
jgi:hypothetical protein